MPCPPTAPSPTSHPVLPGDHLHTLLARDIKGLIRAIFPPPQHPCITKKKEKKKTRVDHPSSKTRLFSFCFFSTSLEKLVIVDGTRWKCFTLHLQHVESRQLELAVVKGLRFILFFNGADSGRGREGGGGRGRGGEITITHAMHGHWRQ